jgi:uncharacterized membrane protein
MRKETRHVKNLADLLGLPSGRPVSYALNFRGIIVLLGSIIGTIPWNNPVTDAIQSKFMRKETRHVKNLADLLQQVVRVSKQPGLA